jgi:hypothetical protein
MGFKLLHFLDNLSLSASEAVVSFLKKTAYIVPTNPDQGIFLGIAMRLTKTVIDRISPPTQGQAFYRDDTLKGFAVRVTPGGAKSFIVETRVHGRMRRETLGRYGPLTVEQARKEAQNTSARSPPASIPAPVSGRRAHAP